MVDSPSIINHLFERFGGVLYVFNAEDLPLKKGIKAEVFILYLVTNINI